MLIAERFLLLALDPSAGTIPLSHSGTDLGALCAAALVVDLATQGRLFWRPPNLVIEDRLPPAHYLLDRTAKALQGHTAGGIANAVARVERRLSPLPTALLEGLFRRDFLHRVRDWRFWRHDAVRYPLRSWQARNEAQYALEQAAAMPGNVGGLAVAMLCDLAGTLTSLLDAANHERTAAALLTLNDVAPDQSERYVLAAVRQALLA